MHRFRTVNLKLLAIILGVSLIWPCFQVYFRHALQHKEITDTAQLYIANVENDLTLALNQVYTVQALIVGTDGEQVELEKISTIMEREDTFRCVKYVYIAPNGIVDQVYPLQGNSYILGTDLFSDTYVNAQAVQEAWRTGKLVVSPAFQTRTGERIIIGRIPVYLSNRTGGTAPWGVASVGVSFREIFDNLHADELINHGYAYRIVVTDPDQQAEEALINRDFSDTGHIISHPFTLAGIQLRIDVTLGDNWSYLKENYWIFFQSILITVILGFLLEKIYCKLQSLRTEIKSDRLTGLLNRTSAEKQINGILRGKDFHNGAFVMMDIDHFKEVNDTFGHQRGDAVLKECAALLKAPFRQKDIVSRLGGDEFVAFLPFSGNVAFLEEKLQRLLQSMQQEIRGKGMCVSISVSIGVCLAPEHGETFGELYANADTALYRAKAMGRNCYVMYDPAEELPESEAVPQSYAERRTILIVEDDFINRELIKNIFSDRFLFLEAENGRQGLEMIHSHKAELSAVLIDASMPVLSGLEMLKAMQADNIPAQIPTFMITAHTESKIAEEAYTYGVRDVINKPISPVVIKNRVQTVIELFQARDLLKQLINRYDKGVSP